ncbi:BON domain-containing protein [Nonomuraea jabiensis]|uniref:BON domain-containing protein n=1 Tax=Nonomuraea jabiensis TaxID=882448 RepID=A0A7W9LG66_9ACTN|nr:BON domain-containing protein [Nonomuraea jabiensis]MBB5782607.1 hypothetical protein [Nonomuraea jabiensis]
MVDTNTGRIVGTLHQRDVLRVFIRPAEELAADIRAVLRDPAAFTVGIHQGVVTIGGVVEWKSQALALMEQLRLIEGVVDVRSEVTFDKDDLLIVPSGM